MPPAISRRLITATLTPLDDHDRLHTDGLEAHLDDQHRAGIRKLLIAGTMGLMPLLPDQTWIDLVRVAVELNKGRFELLIGATDHSTTRMLQRIEFLNSIDGIDGVTVMTPSFYKFTAEQYEAFYREVASASRYPVLIYHLPGLTGLQLPEEAWLAIAGIPNIIGAKFSGCVSLVRKLAPRWPEGFRAIVAEPMMTDQLFHAGVAEHLDGIWALVPELAVTIDRACEQGLYEQAADAQNRLCYLHSMLVEFGVFEAATVILNARGVPGRMAPKPIGALSEDRAGELLDRLEARGVVGRIHTGGHAS